MVRACVSYWHRSFERIVPPRQSSVGNSRFSTVGGGKSFACICHCAVSRKRSPIGKLLRPLGLCLRIFHRCVAINDRINNTRVVRCCRELDVSTNLAIDKVEIGLAIGTHNLISCNTTGQNLRVTIHLRKSTVGICICSRVQEAKEQSIGIGIGIHGNGGVRHLKRGLRCGVVWTMGVNVIRLIGV